MAAARVPARLGRALALYVHSLDQKHSSDRNAQYGKKHQHD